MTQNTPHTTATREKSRAAMNSVAAAVLLTALKLVVGLATNSLGILSEAAHSGLDLLAAGVTFWAVRYASLPPDPGHPYGHGKAENLAALVETLLLLFTCAWVVHEAVVRLFFEPVPVKASFWAFLVMAVSIVVDYSRSRMLLRVAKAHNSQALEADALHFSTDIWSSAVVIVGLAALYLASLLDPASAWRPWLERADSLAALGVCVIIVHVSLKLGRKAVNVLLDAGDAAAMVRIRAVLVSLPGVRQVESLRLRHGGPTLFVEAALSVDGSLSLEEAHAISARAKQLIEEREKDADVSVHCLPLSSESPDRLALVRRAAAAHGFAVHSVEIMELEGAERGQAQLLLELHVEMRPDLSLGEGHRAVSGFEEELRGKFPQAAIVTHLEPQEALDRPKLSPQEDNARIERALRTLLAAHPEISDCHNVHARTYGGGLYVTFHCRMPQSTTVAQAHAAASMLQAMLHRELPDLHRVTVHMEPLKTGSTPPPSEARP